MCASLGSFPRIVKGDNVFNSLKRPVNHCFHGKTNIILVANHKMCIYAQILVNGIYASPTQMDKQLHKHILHEINRLVHVSRHEKLEGLTENKTFLKANLYNRPHCKSFFLIGLIININ